MAPRAGMGALRARCLPLRALQQTNESHPFRRKATTTVLDHFCPDNANKHIRSRITILNLGTCSFVVYSYGALLFVGKGRHICKTEVYFFPPLPPFLSSLAFTRSLDEFLLLLFPGFSWCVTKDANEWQDLDFGQAESHQEAPEG